MQLFWFILYIVPKNTLSRFIGILVCIRWPFFVRKILLRAFASRYNINLEEAERPIDKYSSIAKLFTRRLKAGIRPLSESKIVHPVDGTLTRSQKIVNESLIQAKTHTFSLPIFLKEPKAYEIFKNGKALTYYLCPTDYHRVHAPCEGEIISIQYIPGKLWPVNNWSVNSIDNLFSSNERVVIWMGTEFGPVAYVMVGATNVGKMTLNFDKSIVTNQSFFKSYPVEKSYSPRIEIKKGDELGTFNMGSTVIVLYPEGVTLSEVIKPFSVKYGESVGLTES